MSYVNPTECCGLDEIASVGDSDKEEILGSIAEAREGKAGLAFATTTTQQRAGSKMRSCGFRAVWRFRNPNTGNRVTVWMRETKRRRGEPKSVSAPNWPVEAYRW